MKNIDFDKYKIVSYKKGYETRYKIVDASNESVIDDAQGYGFSSYQKAVKCLYWKINRDEIRRTDSKNKKIYKEIEPKIKEFLWILEDFSYVKEGLGVNDMLRDFWNAVTNKYPELEQYNNKGFNKILLNDR